MALLSLEEDSDFKTPDGKVQRLLSWKNLGVNCMII